MYQSQPASLLNEVPSCLYSLSNESRGVSACLTLPADPTLYRRLKKPSTESLPQSVMSLITLSPRKACLIAFGMPPFQEKPNLQGISVGAPSFS